MGVIVLKLYKQREGGLPGSPGVKTSPSNAVCAGLIPGHRAKILHASWPKNQNIKQKQYCNKFKRFFFFKGERERHREDGQAKTEAETGVM